MFEVRQLEVRVLGGNVKFEIRPSPKKMNVSFAKLLPEFVATFLSQFSGCGTFLSSCLFTYQNNDTFKDGRWI